MKRLIFIIVLSLVNLIAKPQDTVNIWNCFQQAEVNHPLYRQKELNSKSSEYNLSNISKSWYPSVSLDGQATYQSDVVGFGAYTSPHDQYKLYLDINQQLYDGGITKSRKEIEESNLNINQQQVELEFHNIKTQVNSVFFSIVILKKNRELLSITHGELTDRMETLQVAIQNGTVLPENEYVLRAEILKIEQQQDELNYKISATVEILNKLTGNQISADYVFAVPYGAEILDSISDRPEIQLFEFQKSLVDKNISLNKSIIRPKIFVFTQAGYGKPGLNMLNNEFDTYYIAGAGLQWNLADWGETRNKVKIGNLQKETIDLNKNNFTRNISIALQNELANIDYYKSALVKDKELADLRNRIKENAYSKLQNGTITATDYLTESNGELYAKLQLEIHKILLVQSNINYQLIKGDI
jgi:outer membrane protein TolC